jgi:hypothetical protein
MRSSPTWGGSECSDLGRRRAYDGRGRLTRRVTDGTMLSTWCVDGVALAFSIDAFLYF